ncbi:MAG: LPS export ABC transporter periplasmic protein LptC [Rhodobacteraceae bacterium]|nr:LPS export ABC transporter periplasmic protein LptC [Paracoccaceae bacterium]
MALHDNIHSRLVFWLKIILPLIALAILATLFLFSRRLEIEGELPYANVDVDELVREQRLTAPEYASVTSDGAALSITAAVARPGAGESGATATGLVAKIETADGLHVDITAAEGRIDPDANRLVLTQGVDMVTSSGYHVTATGLNSDLDRTDVWSDGEITALAPYGKIDAGRMELRLADARTSGYVLVFNMGVKLVYEPPN